MERKKVWVIEDGEYSDYRVLGVFSTRENAELVRSRLKSGDIEEWQLDPAVDKLNAGLDMFYIQMLRDGTVRYTLAEHFLTEEWEYINTRPDIGNDCDGLRVWLFARDEQHAVKIANEKRLQAIANGNWPASSANTETE